MYRLWLEDKLTMAEVDGPALPARCLSIDDVMDMHQTLDEWHDADRRMRERKE